MSECSVDLFCSVLCLSKYTCPALLLHNYVHYLYYKTMIIKIGLLVGSFILHTTQTFAVPTLMKINDIWLFIIKI